MAQERLHLWVPVWLKKTIKERAKEKGVTMSEWIKDALKHYVNSNH